MRFNWRAIAGELLAPFARAWIRYAPVAVGKKLAWKHFAWRHREFTSRTKFGAVVRGNTQDLIQRYIHYFGIWEPSLTAWISSRLKAGDGFIDVGANVGYYSLLASKCVGASGSVVAVEAASQAFADLNRNVALSAACNVRTVRAAAAAERGLVRLYIAEDGNTGQSTTIPQSRPSEEVEALPLCEILTTPELLNARIIKVDVEGAELEVFRGFASVLTQLRDDTEIVMEISPELMPHFNAATAEIFDTLEGLGFKSFAIENVYSADRYLNGRAAFRPVVITRESVRTQTDVLFSRETY